MQDNTLSFHQALYTIVLFHFGSSVVIGISTSVKQDTLIAILGASLAAFPLFLMYARISKLFPGKNLFEIAGTLFGKFGEKVVALLLTWYAIHLASLILRNFSEFTQVSSMPETPQLPIILLMGLTTIYLARSNIRAIGKWSVVSFFLVLFVVLFTFIAAVRQIQLVDILPLMEHPAGQIVKSSFQVFAFPYAESVIILCLGVSFPKGKTYRIFNRALLLTTVIFLLVFLRNLVLLGQKMMETSYYPSYVTARVIEIADFLARIEGLISSNFLLAGIVKISVCLLAASKGMSSLFGLGDHRPMVLPCGVLAMALCTILYKNMMDMFAFFEYYAFYAFPFQIIIPVIIFIAGEVHVRKKKSEQAPIPATSGS